MPSMAHAPMSQPGGPAPKLSSRSMKWSRILQLIAPISCGNGAAGDLRISARVQSGCDQTGIRDRRQTDKLNPSVNRSAIAEAKRPPAALFPRPRPCKVSNRTSPRSSNSPWPPPLLAAATSDGAAWADVGGPAVFARQSSALAISARSISVDDSSLTSDRLSEISDRERSRLGGAQNDLGSEHVTSAGNGLEQLLTTIIQRTTQLESALHQRIVGDERVGPDRLH